MLTSTRKRSRSGFFSNGDVDFPTPTAHSFGAAAQSMLFEGDELTKPGIQHFVRSGTRACVVVNARQTGFAGRFASTARHLFIQVALLAGAKEGGWTIDEHLDEDEQGL